MKIYKKIKYKNDKPIGEETTYTIEYLGQEFRLNLVTSVALFEAKMFYKENRYKVKDDAYFLKNLIKQAADNPSKETLESLIQMEHFYLEIQGTAPEGSTKEEAKKIQDNKAAARNDIFANSSNDDIFEISKHDNNADIEISSQPTLGELVEAKKAENGRKRNAWRKT